MKKSAGIALIRGFVKSEFSSFFQTLIQVYVSLVSGSAEDPIFVYPNPSTDLIFLGGLIYEIYDVEVMDLSGKVLLTKVSIDLQSAESEINQVLELERKGIYFLKFYNPGYSKVISLIRK
ncbi:MAG: T9SS type A sorting domain-containing protein [Cyclobacteriaceae bacterium]